MNCRLGYLRSLGNNTPSFHALSRGMPCPKTDDGGGRSRRRGAQRKCGGFREAGQSLVDSALSGFVEHIRKRLVRGADHGTKSARGNSLGGAATFYESFVQSIPLSSCGPLDAHARAACVSGEAATGCTWHEQGGAPATRPPRLRCARTSRD